MRRGPRRAIAAALAALGGILMFLAPEVWAGLVLLVLGAAIEIVGISLEHRDGP